MSEQNVNKNGEHGKSSEQDFVSKDDYKKVLEQVEGLAKKNDDLLKIITSPEFLRGRSQEPAPQPKPQKPPEKEYTAQEIDNMTPSQLFSYQMKRFGNMLEDFNEKVEGKVKNLSSRIDSMAETDEDREVQRQIKDVISEFGQDEFDTHKSDMYKTAVKYPNLTARDCYLITVGEKNPPKKAPVPKPTETEKPGQGVDTTDKNLELDDSAEKAWDEALGGKETIQ